jgi:hypothetical protein
MRLNCRFSLVLFLVALPLVAFAQPVPTERAIEWQPVTDAATTVLSVQRPNGEVTTETFAAGFNPMFNVDGLADGVYSYELRTTRSDSEPLVQSGTFIVANGAMVPTVRPSTPISNTFFTDFVSAAGGVCAGADCTSSESFALITVKLKANNTRIKFEDTSTTAGFPSTDWQLSANDTSSGGANKFTIEDLTAATVPFLIEGATPTNTLVLDSTGRLGIGVASPSFQIHHSSGARLDAGNWVNASSRAVKQDIQTLDAVAALETLKALQPVTFAYKANPAETNVGFIAEDVPALVATSDRKGLSSMDIVAVLTKVIQEQQRTIEGLQTRLQRLEQKEQ